MADTASIVWSCRLAREEVERVEFEFGCDSFHGFECEVAFAAFEAAHVGAVYAEDVGEGFLGQAAFEAVVAKVSAECSLEVSFHQV